MKCRSRNFLKGGGADRGGEGQGIGLHFFGCRGAMEWKRGTEKRLALSKPEVREENRESFFHFRDRIDCRFH